MSGGPAVPRTDDRSLAAFLQWVRGELVSTKAQRTAPAATASSAAPAAPTAPVPPNTVYAGPTSGSGAPSFRRLTAADVPQMGTAYTPSTPADWGATPPSTVAGALDMLAARIAALETP